MKVCLLMAGDEEGGLEQHFVELANGLSQHLELVIIAHKKYENRFKENIIFEALDLSKSRKNPLKLFQLTKIINKHTPDLVHAHANKATSMLASIRFFISAKTVATLHNQKKTTTMFDNMNHVIGVSHAVLENVSNLNKTAIYNGVVESSLTTTKNLVKADLGIGLNRSVAISVGRLVKAKGMDILIQAWDKIDSELLIIGDGPDKEQLEKLVLKHDLSGSIQFLGHRNDVAALIALADVVIIASRREGFSYVCAESLLLNTPVISTDVPVANEVLPKKYIVEIEQIEALNHKIADALHDLEAVRDDFKAVFQQAQKEFTFDFMMQRTIECYVKCLGIVEN